MRARGSVRDGLSRTNSGGKWHENSLGVIGIGDATLTSKGEVSEFFTLLENVSS